MRAIIGNLISAAVLVLVVDVVAYLFLPERLAWRIHPYRCVACTGADDRDLFRSVPPVGYYSEDAEAAYDLTRDFANGTHWVDGSYYPVWTNALGCFDVPRPDLGRYVYLAGDSQAWGYAPLAQKFGTLAERALGVPILQCGVPHTGQRQQLLKLRRIVGEIGHAPDVLVVAYFANDVANDLAHPHSRVVEGHLVDTRAVEMRDGRWTVVSVPEEDLRAELASYQPAPEGWPRLVKRAKLLARVYSFTFNAAVLIRDEVGLLFPESGIGFAQTIYKPELWQEEGRFTFPASPVTEPNREAIRAMRDEAGSMGAALLFLLIPPARTSDWAGYYGALHPFLEAEGIRYLDLGPAIAARVDDPDRLYWPVDHHLSPAGNAFVAEELTAALRPLLARPGTTTAGREAVGGEAATGPGRTGPVELTR